jgi:hypothetical protein
MPARTVLVLGGGVGGLVTANELRRRLGPSDRVVLVERERRHLFQPSLLWLMVGRRRRDQIERRLSELLDPGVELVEAEVTSIDPAARRVETTTGVLVGDALVVALGAEPDRDAVPGYHEAALDFFSPEGAAACALALEGFRGGRVVVTVAALPYKCPAAPYEAALLLDAELRRRGLRERSEIDVYSPEPAPMPVAGPVMGAAVVGLLDAKGISFHPGSRVDRFEPASHEIVLAEGSRVGYDLLAGVPPHRAPAAVRGCSLAGDTGGSQSTARPSRPATSASMRSATRQRSRWRMASPFRAPASSPTARASWSLAGSPRPSPDASLGTPSMAPATAGSRPERDAPHSPSASSSPNPTRRSPSERRVARGMPARCSSSNRGSAVGSSGGWPGRASPSGAASSA